MFRAVRNITTHINKNKISFGTENIRNAMVNMTRYVSTPESVRLWSSAIYNLTAYNNCIILFGTEEVRNTIVKMSQYTTTSESVIKWCR
jgi:hypothetical protein